MTDAEEIAYFTAVLKHLDTLRARAPNAASYSSW